ncbi:UvrD-helicase domain-containing protein [Treponema sp.]|uniref:UvrD-helicase domain-containing protein n=1 Tax=Treponema sp. TaxID=166 RepID=UPI00257AED38|nr:UvrD-helicase domain-containing protein [Treponema sp.]MBE6355147.1 hypothetical protein [Treponema sp.]
MTTLRIFQLAAAVTTKQSADEPLQSAERTKTIKEGLITMADTKKNIPDEFQSAAIKAKKNSVVSAGAGSGKTSVLSQRFLDLVQNRNCNVDEILTLTFTKKATIEMSSRIYDVLKKNSPEKAADFYKANIKTLDAYCNSVAKAGSHFYGISPDFTQDKETAQRKIQEMALPFILKHRDNPAIKALVKTNDYAETAQAIFVDVIANNSTVVTPIDFDADLSRQKQLIIKAWDENQKKIFSDMDNFLGLWNSVPENPGSSIYVNAQEYLRDFTKPYKTELTLTAVENHSTEEIEETFSALAYFCNTPKVGRLKNLKEANEYLISAAETLKILQQIITYVQSLDIIEALFPLLKEFQKAANDFKRQSGILSFKDISDIALKTLIEHPEIRKIEKQKYKAIMIDEFQDNNQTQRDMLFLLAEKQDRMDKSVPSVDELEEEKLFFVGDEKQSIYRFRGADVSVFRKLSEDFKDGNLQMSTNYRSHQSLIASFNTIFGGIPFPPALNSTEKKDLQPSVFYTEQNEEELKKEGLSIPEYEAVYHEVTLSKSAKEQITAETYKDIYQPHIHLAFTDDSETEAEWVVQKIKALIENGADENKKVSPGDIAILFRSYESQALYERILLKHGIPYNTETVKGFFSDGPVNDIFSFLRLCAYPYDTLSYAQLLRSPFVNLSITEVNAILIKNKEPFSSENESLLSPDGCLHYKKAAELFTELKNKCRTASLTELIDTLWYEAGYRYETLWNTQVSMYSKLYDLIFEFARKCESENMSVAAFVDELRNYKDDRKKLEDMDIPIVQHEGVHLMSIHKSKGLEFEIVFIPVTNKKGMAEKNTLPVYFSKNYGFTINTVATEDSYSDNKNINYFFTLAEKENIQKENAELRRLTYVALTRAVNSLYISKSKEDPANISPEKFTPGNEERLSTIYNTLFPVINFYKEKEELNFCPFTFEDIELNDEPESSLKHRRNTQEAKYMLLEDIKKLDVYSETSGTKILSLDEVQPRYILPSQLYHEEENLSREQSSKLSEQEKAAPYKEIDEIIIQSIPEKKSDSPARPRFSFTDFGTIAHSFLESALSPEKNLPKYSNKDIIGLENSRTKLETVTKACNKMTDAFLNSPLGQKAVSAEWKKCEYEFKYHADGYIIHGTMDLIFKNSDGTYTVVDYKTNQTIKPEMYYNQLSAYKEAASQMLGLPAEKIKCSLFYLRYGKEVDITEKCSKPLDWKSIITM